MARLSAGTLAVAVVAVLLALTGAFAVRQFLEQREGTAPIAATTDSPEAEVVLIPVAVTDLESGRVIRESDFANVKMSRPDFSKSQYAQKAFVNRVEQLKGRVLRTEVPTGSTVGPTQLYAEGTGPTVADKLPEGMRAVTVKVSGAGFADGFASPGTFVDVLFRSSGLDEDTKDVPETTITAMTRIEVLAVDATPYPQSQPEAARRSSDTQEARVTFSVKPSQATMLKALEDRGEISLALRPLAEAGNAVGHGVDEEPEVERHAQTVMQILEGVKATPVVVATTELVQGRVVRPGDLRLVEAEEVSAEIPDGVTYKDIEALVGRTLRSDVTPGQIITADILYPEGVSPGVADRLPRGFRAVTVNMSNAALVDGFVSPGTEVDVFFRAEALEGYPETTLRVLDGLSVLAIEDRVSGGSDIDSKDTGGKGVRVTLAVPLGEVGRIQALEGHGTMTLAVRAVGERPIGEIARELESTQEQLERTQQHIAALKQISQLDDSIELSKEQKERLSALSDELPLLERKLASLSEEKDAATTGASQTTLAEVLNLPEPARPTRLEIYNGGSRETLVFNAGVRAYSTGRTASRANDNTTTTSSGQKANKPKTAQEPVKQASGTKEVETENVSVVVPNRKVSAIQSNGLRGSDRVAAITNSTGIRSSVVKFSMTPVSATSRSKGTNSSLMSAVSSFGRGLINGLSKATLPAQRVEIVRGGVKD